MNSLTGWTDLKCTAARKRWPTFCASSEEVGSELPSPTAVRCLPSTRYLATRPTVHLVSLRVRLWMLITLKSQHFILKKLLGDARVEEMPLLTVMHTLLVREHNRVAARLAQLNPSWNDEIVYQESRRIVVAEMQHITFTEWLPNILSNYAFFFNLNLIKFTLERCSMVLNQ